MNYNTPYLPLSRLNASFQPELSQAIERVVDCGWYLLGEQVAAFEREFAAAERGAHCVAVANGLDALTLTLTALRLRHQWTEEAEVVVPALTFAATALAVERAGLRPVFSDVGDDFLMTAQAADAVCTPRTVCLLPVHLYGRYAPMRELSALARSRGLCLVEDACQAHGAVRLMPDVAQTDLSCFPAARIRCYSFYPGKNLGCLGDGGAVVTDDAALADTLRTLANYGSRQKYHHELSGTNSRLCELQAAVLRVKLPRLESDNARRQTLARRYAEGLAPGTEGLRLPYGGEVASSVFHVYPLLVKDPEALAAHLQKHGIQTLRHYPATLPEQPALARFAPENISVDKAFPHAWRAAHHELSLPLHPLLSESEVDHIAQCILEYDKSTRQ